MKSNINVLGIKRRYSTYISKASYKYANGPKGCGIKQSKPICLPVFHRGWKLCVGHFIVENPVNYSWLRLICPTYLDGIT
jgi:hypothetical protein